MIAPRDVTKPGVGRRVWTIIKNVGAVCGIVAVALALSSIQNVSDESDQRAQERIVSDVTSCLVGNNRAEGTRSAIASAAYESIYNLAVQLQTTELEAAEYAVVARDSARAAADEEIRSRDCTTVPGADADLVERIEQNLGSR
jgi:hypothetical protein